jgi:hypothetical protein
MRRPFECFLFREILVAACLFSPCLSCRFPVRAAVSAPSAPLPFSPNMKFISLSRTEIFEKS